MLFRSSRPRAIEIATPVRLDAHTSRPLLRLIAGVVLAQTCGMLGSSAFASTLTELARLWRLDSTHAGWISSAYFLGYTCAVPLLVALTDRVDPRKIYLAGCLIGACAALGFAHLARGLWSASLWQALAGAGVGATYMPGLRILTTRLGERARIRAVPYYTTTFAVGTSLSYMLCGWMAAHHGWRSAFLAAAAAPLASAVLVVLATWNIPPVVAEATPTRHPLDLRPALRNRQSMAYVLAYGGHCWEMFAFRAWLPAFLLFAWHLYGRADGAVAVSRWSMLIVLIGVPASILGAESVNAATRNRNIRHFEFASIGLCLAAVALLSHALWLTLAALFAYNFAIAADSGALTAGAIASSRPEEQGATLAVYALVGFFGAGIGPLAVGRALDSTGGFHSAHAWYFGFAAMGIGSALAAIAISGETRVE
jgi:MFS family permease